MSIDYSTNFCESNFVSKLNMQTKTKCNNNLGGTSNSNIKAYLRENLVKSIDLLINKVIKFNSSDMCLATEFADTFKFNKFNFRKQPKMSFYTYIKRLINLSDSDDHLIIASIILLDRICAISNQKLTHKNVHKLFFLSLMISLKFNCDEVFSDSNFSKISGIPISELIILEQVYLELISYNLYIKYSDYEVYKNKLLGLFFKI